MNNFLQDSKVAHPTLAKMEHNVKLIEEERLIASKYLVNIHILIFIVQAAVLTTGK